MLTLTRAVRVYACAQPVDMRKGFDGLSALVGVTLLFSVPAWGETSV
jgi:hypothetical protein